jgi:hypothetical protein
MLEGDKPRVTFSRTIVALSCFLIVVPTSAARAQQGFMTLAERRTGAWWLDAQFHPFTTEVRGIPANKIDKSWCKATELRKDLLPKKIVIEENGGDSMEAQEGFSGFSFALEGNFDGSPRKQTALVGVYEDCSGKAGNFFMILDRAAGRFKVRFLNALPTERQFLALHQEGKMISVYNCLDCDHFSRLQWDRKQKKFVWLPSDAY